MTPSGPNGLLLIDKPAGITSHDAVNMVRRALGIRKVGHAGTLDPMATGLLVMGAGRATRLLRFLGDLPKTYVGALRLGVRTTTLDAEGDMVSEAPIEGVTEAAVSAVMASLLGESEQRPPAFSAVQVGGRKLYAAARKGQPLAAEPRTIRVDAFDLARFEPPDVAFRVSCSGGTYVRVLAADVGTELGCGAHLIRLRRTAIGPFDVKSAAHPEDPAFMLPIETAVGHLPRLDLDEEEAVAAGHGRPLGPSGLRGAYAVFGPDGGLIGVYEDEGAKARALVILMPN